MMFETFPKILKNKIVRVFLAIAAFILLIPIVFVLVFPPQSYKFEKAFRHDTGIANEKSLEEAEFLLGVDFPEKPSKLFYYFEEPGRLGSYHGYMKAEMPHAQFIQIVKKLGMKELSKLPETSSLRNREPWFGPKDPLFSIAFNLDGTLVEQEESTIYGANTDRWGVHFLKYENGFMYYDIFQDRQFEGYEADYVS